MNSLTVRYLVIVVGFSAITVSYWLAADPPNPWFLAITAAGILVSVGITLAKKRAGHFDNPDPTTGRMMIARIMLPNTHKATSQLSRPLCASKPTDPDLSEILTSTPWSAILVPGGLAILVILGVLALVLLDRIKPVTPFPNSLENNSRIEGQ